MSLLRYAKRRDESEAEIILALEQAGVAVRQSDFVDLIAGRAGRTYLLEVKNPNWTLRDLKPSQRELLARWPGHYVIVSSPEEALKAVGLRP